MVNGWYIIFSPILKEGDSYFEVAGANSINKETAIHRASKHSSIKKGSAIIIRIDEYKEYIEWNSENSFLK